ncbi:MAG: hypothetical protein PHF35_03300 [Candidatus Moranbacteria bacterium]|nr:hypothetical protein [Candidatus Moranbacteria bacterium]
MEFEKTKKEQLRTTAKKKVFLQAFGLTLGSVKRSCVFARIHRDTYYDWCKNDPEFAEALKTESEGSIKYLINETKKEMFPPY